MLEFLVLSLCLHDFGCSPARKAYVESRPALKRDIRAAGRRVRQITGPEIVYVSSAAIALYNKSLQIKINRNLNLDIDENEYILNVKLSF